MTYSSTAGSKLNVLIVDDSHFNQTFIGAILGDIGCVCTLASNGAEALEKLNSEIEFRIVFMDCLMPIMGGIAAIQEIRNSGKYENIKIVCMSSLSLPEKIKCHQCIVDAFLEKPVSRESLAKLIAKLRD